MLQESFVHGFVGQRNDHNDRWLASSCGSYLRILFKRRLLDDDQYIAKAGSTSTRQVLSCRLHGGRVVVCSPMKQRINSPDNDACKNGGIVGVDFPFFLSSRAPAAPLRGGKLGYVVSASKRLFWVDRATKGTRQQV
jgi:hypothetical protein